MSALTVTRIRKTFRDVTATRPLYVLDDVTVSVQAPCIVAIVGPNGVGKSTFLRLLACLLQPDDGSILVNGKPLTETRIGYVPSTNPIFPWRRVDDDISLPLEILGMSRQQRRSYAADLLRQFSSDLSPTRRTYALSSGQRQIVNLCRSLIGPEPPELLLLDEPFSSLDPSARHYLLGLLERVQHQFHALIILTTHDLDSACAVADFVVPFRARPVQFSQEDLVAVPVSRPRLHAGDYPLEHCQAREVLEAVFSSQMRGDNS
jgi:NitT/TauT family transport system ATP-binding protein